MWDFGGVVAGVEVEVGGEVVVEVGLGCGMRGGLVLDFGLMLGLVVLFGDVDEGAEVGCFIGATFAFSIFDKVEAADIGGGFFNARARASLSPGIL